VPYCNCFIINNFKKHAEIKRFSLQNREKSCSIRVKPGMPVPVDVVPVPDPTRETSTRPYWSGWVYPRVQIDPHTSSTGEASRHSDRRIFVDIDRFLVLNRPEPHVRAPRIRFASVRLLICIINVQVCFAQAARNGGSSLCIMQGF